jgi:hypothetical protein
MIGRLADATAFMVEDENAWRRARARWFRS